MKVLDSTQKLIQRLKEFQITYVPCKVVQHLKFQIINPQSTLIKILKIHLLITSLLLMNKNLKITYCILETRLERGTMRFLINHLAQMGIRKVV